MDFRIRLINSKINLGRVMCKNQGFLWWVLPNNLCNRIMLLVRLILLDKFKVQVRLLLDWVTGCNRITCWAWFRIHRVRLFLLPNHSRIKTRLIIVLEWLHLKWDNQLVLEILNKIRLILLELLVYNNRQVNNNKTLLVTNLTHNQIKHQVTYSY
jgi:hypothetical protein